MSHYHTLKQLQKQYAPLDVTLPHSQTAPNTISPPLDVTLPHSQTATNTIRTARCHITTLSICSKHTISHPLVSHYHTHKQLQTHKLTPLSVTLPLPQTAPNTICPAGCHITTQSKRFKHNRHNWMSNYHTLKQLQTQSPAVLSHYHKLNLLQTQSALLEVTLRESQRAPNTICPA
jgi:hypothetical protein